MLKMPKKVVGKYYYFWFSFFSVIILDQLSKFFILRFFPQKVFRSLGVFGDFPFAWIGFFIALIVLFFLLFRRIFFQEKSSILLFGAVIAAAVSNILDKYIWAAILDWIPIFGLKLNLADFVLIICGVALVFQHWLKMKD